MSSKMSKSYFALSSKVLGIWDLGIWDPEHMDRVKDDFALSSKVLGSLAVLSLME